MIQRIKNIQKDELVRGGVVLFVMLLIYNLLNYIFQISMARLLGPSDYSILAALMSIIYVFSIPNEAIQTVISRYTSKFNPDKQYGKMKELLWKSIRRGLFFSAILFSVYIPFAFFLSNFLNVQTGLIVLTGFFIFYVFMFPVTRGMLQGRKKFKALGLNLILESATKVLFSIILVYLGWKVYGVIIALIISWIIMFFFSFRFLKEVTSARSEKGEFDKIYSSSIPVIVAMTSIVLMYSLDIIFARGFFPPQKAGEFAFVALIGKTILFVSSAVGKAMFPLSSEEFEKGQRSGGLLKKSLFLVGLIASAAVTVFFLFPKQIIWLVSLGSTQYLEAYPLLFKLGASYALLSISNILLLYRLSIHKLNRAAYFLLVFAVLEIILLLTMRSNLEEFTQGIFISNIAMFLYSVWISFTK